MLITPVNAVYGFTAMLMKLIDDLKPDHVAVVFDVACKLFVQISMPAIRPIVPAAEELFRSSRLAARSHQSPKLTTSRSSGF